MLDWERAHVGQRIEDRAWCEWVVRMHHREQVGALGALFAGYGACPAWAERQAAMLAQYRRLIRFSERWVPGGDGVRQWQGRVTCRRAPKPGGNRRVAPQCRRWRDVTRRGRHELVQRAGRARRAHALPRVHWRAGATAPGPVERIAAGFAGTLAYDWAALSDPTEPPREGHAKGKNCATTRSPLAAHATALDPLPAPIPVKGWQ